MTNSLLIQNNKYRSDYQLLSLEPISAPIFFSEFDLLYYNISFSQLTQNCYNFRTGYGRFITTVDYYNANAETFKKYILTKFGVVYKFFVEYYNYNSIVYFGEHKKVNENDFYRFYNYVTADAARNANIHKISGSFYNSLVLIPANRNIYVKTVEEFIAVLSDDFIALLCSRYLPVFVHLTSDIEVNDVESIPAHGYQRRLIIIGHGHTITVNNDKFFQKCQRVFFKQCKIVINNAFSPVYLGLYYNIFVDCDIFVDFPPYSFQGENLDFNIFPLYSQQSNVVVMYNCRVTGNIKVNGDFSYNEYLDYASTGRRANLTFYLFGTSYFIISKCLFNFNIYTNFKITGKGSEVFTQIKHFYSCKSYKESTIKDNVFLFNSYIDFNNVVSSKTPIINNYISLYPSFFNSAVKNIDLQNNKIVYNYKITGYQNDAVGQDGIIVDAKLYDEDKFIDSRDENNTLEVHKLE